MPDPTPWYQTRRGPPVVVGYALVTVVVAVSTGWGDEWPEGSLDAQIPLYVSLSGFLGGMNG